MVLGEELLQQQHSHVSSEAAAAGGGMMAANNRTRSEQHIPSIVLPLHTQVHTTLPSQPAVLCPLARTSQNNSASNLYGMGKPSASSPSLYGMGTGAPSPALHTITPLSPAAAAAAPQAGGGGGGGGGLDSLPLPFKSIASSNLIAERVLVVANRLPVTCSKKPDGTWQLQSSSGGLVSALKVIQLVIVAPWP